MGSSRPIEHSRFVSPIPRAPTVKFSPETIAPYLFPTRPAHIRQHIARPHYGHATDRRDSLEKATDPDFGTALIMRKVGVKFLE
jgi:hypothetical protein